MGFKDFCKTSQTETTNNTKKVEDLYDKYKDKNQDELLNELFSSVHVPRYQERRFDHL